MSSDGEIGRSRLFAVDGQEVLYVPAPPRLYRLGPSIGGLTQSAATGSASARARTRNAPKAHPVEMASRLQGTSVPASLGRFVLPRLVLDVSHACNLACAYCFQAANNARHDYMTPDTATRAFARVLDRYPGGVRSVMFFGGEPLLAMKTLRAVGDAIIRMASERGVPAPSFCIQTNGLLLTQKIVDYLAEGGFSITVSLDGPAPVSDRLRHLTDGRGSYDRVLRGLSLLLAAGVPFNIEATYTAEHVRQGYSVVDVIGHLADLGARVVHVMPVLTSDRRLAFPARASAKIANEFRRAAESSVLSLATDRPQPLQYSLYVIENLTGAGARHLCYAGIGSLTVEPDGGVYPCYFLALPDFRMGNAAGDGDWPEFEVIRDRMLTHPKAAIPACGNCWARELCNSCYGYSRRGAGTLGSPAPTQCQILQAMVEGTLSALVAMSESPSRWLAFLAGARAYLPALPGLSQTEASS